MLYIRCPDLTHLAAGSLYPLTNTSPFLPNPRPQQPKPNPSKVVCILYNITCQFLLFLSLAFLDSTCKWKHSMSFLKNLDSTLLRIFLECLVLGIPHNQRSILFLWASVTSSALEWQAWRRLPVSVEVPNTSYSQEFFLIFSKSILLP